MSQRLLNFAKQPFLHFLLIGAAIYAGYGYLNKDAVVENPRAVTISSGEINWLRDSWKKRWNRNPTAAELEGIVKQYLREIVLYREALTLGLDKNDVVIRRRLAQKLEFLSNDLIQPPKPTKQQMRAYLTKNAKRFEIPARVTMTHVFFDPDKRDKTTLGDAKAEMTKLNGAGSGPRDVSNLGDRFLLQSYYPERSYDELDKLFGRGFSKQFAEAEVGKWLGPVLSGYGVHLVYLHSRQEARQPELAAIEKRLAEEWTAEKRKDLSEKFVEGVLARYTVKIENEKLASKLRAKETKTQ